MTFRPGRLAGLIVCIATMAAPAMAQDDPRFALVGSLPSPTVSLQWEVSEKFALRFEGDYRYRNESTQTLEIEFTRREIPFRRELPCNIVYKGHQLRGDYRVDFICYEEVVLEIKARSVIGPADHAQIISYLAATKLQVGLLFNFGTPKLEHKRFVRTGSRD